MKIFDLRSLQSRSGTGKMTSLHLHLFGYSHEVVKPIESWGRKSTRDLVSKVSNYVTILTLFPTLTLLNIERRRMQTIEQRGHAQSIVGRGTKRARAATDYDDDDEDVVVTMDARSKEGNLNG